MNIKVSVIVPIYNVEKYVRKCIESILHQTYRNLEIILVDDGTMDSSGKIADEYADQDARIKVIHQNNKGVSFARNTGLDRATGDYVCFVDGDDYVMEDYVSYLLRLILEYHADISLTTEMFGTFKGKKINSERVRIYSAEEAALKMLCYEIPIGCYCKLFRKDFLDEKKLRFQADLKIGEGFCFNMATIQRADRVVFGNRKIYYYRRENIDSATIAFSKEKAQNGMLALEKIREDIIFCSKEMNHAWEFARWRTATDMFDQLVLSGARMSYPKEIMDYKYICRKGGWIAFVVPVSMKQRVRAVIMMVFPDIMPKLVSLRRKR